MKKITNLVLALMFISSTLVHSQENPQYTPFSTSPFQVPLIQNFTSPPNTIVDKSKISFDIGPINQSGNIDLVTTYSFRFTDGNNQYSGNRGYWNLNLLNSNYEQPSGPFLNQSELATGPGYFSNDNAFINLRQLSLERKDLAVVKDNGLYVYKNDNNAISSSNYQYISGGIGTSISVGNFNYYNTYEDALVINGNQIKIYLNDGNGQLLQTPYSFNISTSYLLKAKLARVFNQIEPYNRFPNIKSDIIIADGQNIYIYKNNNDNTVTLYQTMNVGFQITDFELSDVSRRGWNDLIVVGNTGRMKVFLNAEGLVNTEPVYDYTGSTSYIYYNPVVTTSDLSKTGLKDIIVASYGGYISAFQNTGDGSLFNQTQPQQYINMQAPSLNFDKIKTVDIYNTGGIALVLSKSGGSLNDYFQIFRFNPSTPNTIPQPPIVTKGYFFDGSFWRPRIYIDKNKVRDFNHFELFKRSPNTNNNWVSLGTVSDDYTDFNEFCIVAEDGPIAPQNNCFYVAKNIDNTNYVSNNSNSVGFRVGNNNPYPIGEIACDNLSNGSIKDKTPGLLKSFSVTNFPNPFNPVTNIIFNIPKESKVTIKIYNSLGQEIQTLTDKNYGIGNHIIEFNAGNLPSGIYFYRITAGNFTKVNRLMLIK
jgi:hypothetical protein